MNNFSKILIGVSAGLVTGAVLGILFAPDKGEDTRKEISDRVKKLTDSLESAFKKGKEKYSDIKEKVDQFV
jgi:gas vesicle protein